MDDNLVKKCYCGDKAITNCQYKQHYVNNRCFAPYAVRQTCRYIIREDRRTLAEGSQAEGVWFK